MKPIALLLLLSLSMSVWRCQPKEEGTQTEPDTLLTAQSVVDSAIARHGGERYNRIVVEFDFRKYHYRAMRRGGAYIYERLFTDTLGNTYHDVLSNEGLYREANGERQELTAKDSSAYANSVNSVVYFALLPSFLNDPAVQKEYLGEETVKGEPYRKVGVTFRQEGGGKDHEDEFVYWFHQINHTLDYLAYNYQTSGGGARLREAHNAREVNGIRFQDYHNYKPTDESMEVATFAKKLEAGEMDLVSEIDTEGPEVEVLDIGDE